MIAVIVLVSAMSSASDRPDATACTPPPSPHLRVRLTLPDRPIHAGIHRIVDAVWRPAGLTFDWADGFAENPWTGIDLWIAAVDGTPVTRDGDSLGATRFGNGTPRPLIRLYTNAIIAWVERYESRRFLMPIPGRPLRLGGGDALVDDTMGYAAAHEIGHFVLASKTHATSGVMRAGYRRPDEFSDPATWQVDRMSRERLHDRLTRGLPCQTKEEGRLARKPEF